MTKQAEEIQPKIEIGEFCAKVLYWSLVGAIFTTMCAHCYYIKKQTTELKKQQKIQIIQNQNS